MFCDFKMLLSVRIKDVLLLLLLLYFMIDNFKLRLVNIIFVGYIYYNVFFNEDVFIKLNFCLSFFES